MPVFVKKNRRSVFYVHVPKTGGSYVEDLFRANNYKVNFWCANPINHGVRIPFQHVHRALYRQIIIPQIRKNAFITVRHPIGKLLSRHRNIGYAMDLIPWLDRVEAQLLKEPSTLRNHLRPQADFVDDDMHVFKQEDRFNAAWAEKLSDLMDLGFHVFEVESRKDTESKRGVMTSAERDRVLEFVRTHYSCDFEVFGYREEESKDLRLSLEADAQGAAEPATAASG